jgi:hypothetical protein
MIINLSKVVAKMPEEVIEEKYGCHWVSKNFFGILIMEGSIRQFFKG